MQARVWLVSAALFLGLGCSSTHLYGESMRGVDLDIRRRVHVVRHDKDKQHIDGMIARRLERSGFDASSGPRGAPLPEGAQAVVSYEDHWMWDLTMYILTLRIDFRDPATNELLASGQSFRTSTASMPAEFMVDEIITAILAGS